MAEIVYEYLHKNKKIARESRFEDRRRQININDSPVRFSQVEMDDREHGVLLRRDSTDRDIEKSAERIQML